MLFARPSYLLFAVAFTLACGGPARADVDAPARPRCFHLPPTGPDALPTYSGAPLSDHAGVQVLAPSTEFCPIIMSIYGSLLDLIAEGRKSYEYRKSFPSEPVSHILYYDNTAKVIRGFARVVRTLFGPPGPLVDVTWMQSGVSASALNGYFGTYATGFAIEFRDYRALATPLPLADVQAANPSFEVPRGYAYLEDFAALQAEVEAQMRAAP